VPRVLVIGWGFLGAAIGHGLLDDGAHVSGLTRSESSRTAAARMQGIPLTIGDAGDKDTVESAMRDVDHVIYVAGGLNPPTAAQRPVEDAAGTLSPLLCTLERLRHVPDVSFTYISSGGAIYGNPETTVATETDSPRPVSSYGVSRLAGELYTQVYAASFGVSTRVIRCSNVYGPGQSPSSLQGAVAVFLHRVARDLTVAIVGDGTSVRDYVHIDDVTAAISQLVVGRVDCGIVNLGSGSGHSTLELLGIVGATVGRVPVIEYVPRRPHDVDAIVLDITKLRSLIPFESMTLRDGVRSTWDALNAGKESGATAVF
jgi:UDP-glucose 4-epimerase